MKSVALFLLGVAAWIGVAVLAVGMAEWNEPVWGFFPIAIAVLAAWAVGEFVTGVVWKDRSDRNA